MNAQGPKTTVTIFETNYRDTPPQDALYTDGGDTYSFSKGTENDLILDAIQIDDGTGTSGIFNVAVDKLADRIEIRRVDNAFTTGNRHITFFEQASSYSGPTKDFKGNLFTTMEESLLSTIIGSGSDNIFANTNITNTNNIERIDYIFDEGIVVPADPNEGGFPILERGGNDAFLFAPITALDGSGDPSSYSDLQYSRNLKSYRFVV